MQLKTIPEDFVVVEIAQHELSPDGPYALFELTKRNCTTERALSTIGDRLNLQRKFLGYAGTKDARALTKQFITIKSGPDIAERAKGVRSDMFVLRFIGFVKEPLGLGQLSENRFEITCRKLKEETLSELALIPNYFDEQRFSTANAQIGKFILQGALLDAANLIISTDPDAGLRMKEHLAVKINDAVGALRMVPKNILLMYVHAYQSLLYNEVLARYIKMQDQDAVYIDGPVPLVVPTKPIAQITIPIVGFDTRSHPLFGAWYDEILAREGLTQRDFVVRTLPFLTVEGSERTAFFEVLKFDAGPREQDDIFQEFEKQFVTFTLPKACYATMVIKCLYRVGRVLGGNDAPAAR